VIRSFKFGAIILPRTIHVRQAVPKITIRPC